MWPRTAVRVPRPSTLPLITLPLGYRLALPVLFHVPLVNRRAVLFMRQLMTFIVLTFVLAFIEPLHYLYKPGCIQAQQDGPLQEKIVARVVVHRVRIRDCTHERHNSSRHLLCQSKCKG